MEETENQTNESSSIRLHPHTNTSLDAFCFEFLNIIRRSQVSKTAANDLLLFIKSISSVPNAIPSNMDKLTNHLDIIDYFQKKIVCILCGKYLQEKQSACSHCPAAESKHVAIILDANLLPLLTTIVTRLADDIHNYKKIIASGNHQAPYDVPFGKQYRRLLTERKGQNLLSLILHIDGISLVKSTKLKLWLCSSSIIEVPPHVRTQRQNIVLLSMYVGYTEPDVKLWLNSSLTVIQELKKTGRKVVDFIFCVASKSKITLEDYLR